MHQIRAPESVCQKSAANGNVNTTLLITFGCSWTWGAGVGYEPGMSQKKYHDEIFANNRLSDTHSFRALLSNEYNFHNINFSKIGGSNPGQFDKAKKFFTSEEFNKARSQYSRIIVLWGITSVSRFDFESIEQNKVMSIFFNFDNEVNKISTDIDFWNMFFKSIGIENFWFDTFNHHDYTSVAKNILFNNRNPRDLFSLLAIEYGIKELDQIHRHESSWVMDNNSIPFLVERGLLNPHSFHPTKLGHRKIAAMIAKELNLK